MEAAMLRDEEWSGVDAIKVEVFCQHCGRYLHTRADIDRSEVAAVTCCLPIGYC
jgi:hypothetical protein